MKNYYKILEVDKNASNEVIKVAYKSLVKKYHPDLKEVTFIPLKKTQYNHLMPLFQIHMY